MPSITLTNGEVFEVPNEDYNGLIESLRSGSFKTPHIKEPDELQGRREATSKIVKFCRDNGIDFSFSFSKKYNCYIDFDPERYIDRGGMSTDFLSTEEVELELYMPCGFIFFFTNEKDAYRVKEEMGNELITFIGLNKL